MSETNIEKPAEDAQEQERDLVEADRDSEEVTSPAGGGRLPFEANEADVAEQDIAVDADEEDSR